MADIFKTPPIIRRDLGIETIKIFGDVLLSRIYFLQGKWIG